MDPAGVLGQLMKERHYRMHFWLLKQQGVSLCQALTALLEALFIVKQ